MIGMTRREARARPALRMNMAARMPPMDRTLAAREVMFWETAWLMASMSLVRRLISSPAGLRSKKARGRFWRRWNRSWRRFRRDFWETPDMAQAAQAWNRLFRT